MTTLNGTLGQRAVLLAKDCPTNGLGSRMSVGFEYLTKVACTSLGLDGKQTTNKYSLQANFTLVGGDLNRYWLQGIILNDPTGSLGGIPDVLCQINIWHRPPIIGHEPYVNAFFGSLTGNDQSVFQNFTNNDNVIGLLDLKLGALKVIFLGQGITREFVYGLPAELLGGNIFYCEALPTSFDEESAVFSSGDWIQTHHTEVLAEWRAVPQLMQQGVDYSPCPNCTLSDLTAEDWNGQYFDPTQNEADLPNSVGELNLTWEITAKV